MGLLNLLLGGIGGGNRRGGADEYRNTLREIRKQKSKLYRTVRTVLTFALVLDIALFVLGLVTPDLRHAWLFKFVAIVFALCVCGYMTLPWITEYERGRKKAEKGEQVAVWHKYVVFGAWAFIGICALLWVISVFVIGDGIETLMESINNADTKGFDFGASFTMLRISLIFTLQAAVGSLIAITSLRYGKEYLLLRAVTYVSTLYLDFWLSWFIGGVTIDDLENGFAPISVTFLWTLAFLMGIAFIVAIGIFNAQTRRKEVELIMKGDVETLTSGDVDLTNVQSKPAQNKNAKVAETKTEEKEPEQQLNKIKELLDKGVITEEEYQQKRKDIIDKM